MAFFISTRDLFDMDFPFDFDKIDEGRLIQNSLHQAGPCGHKRDPLQKKKVDPSLLLSRFIAKFRDKFQIHRCEESLMMRLSA